MEVKRGRALQTRAMAVLSSSTSFKRRRMASNVDDQLLNHHRHEANSPENSNSVSQATSSEASDRAAVMFRNYSSYELSTDVDGDGLRSVHNSYPNEVEVVVQSHAQGSETEISTLPNCRLSTDKNLSPSSEHCGGKDKLGSSMAVKTILAASPSLKLQAGEIEEFFSAAEKYGQKLFADKYNYDVVKDVPLEGRYRWVRLKP